MEARVGDMDSQVIEYHPKCICSEEQWTEIQRKLIISTRVGQQSAVEINRILKGPVVRSGVEIIDAISNGRSIEFSMKSSMPLMLEMLGVTLAQDSPGEWCFLGSDALKGRVIPPWVPTQKCANVGARLGIWIAKTELRGGDTVFSPGPSHPLQAGETIWFRYGRRRYVTPMLVVSESAHRTHVLQPPYLVSESLSGAEQYLLIPATTRPHGSFVETSAPLTSFVERGDITEEHLKETIQFFFGNNAHAEPIAQLGVQNVFRQRWSKGDRPAAIAGEDQLHNIQQGQQPSENDLHGVKPQQRQIEECLNLRSQLGNVAGAIHYDEPQVENLLPERLQGKWFESPLGTYSVIAPGAELLFLSFPELKSRKPQRERCLISL